MQPLRALPPRQPPRRVFHCTACDYDADADLNAAANILHRAESTRQPPAAQSHPRPHVTIINAMDYYVVIPMSWRSRGIEHFMVVRGDGFLSAELAAGPGSATGSTPQRSWR
jgi:hypothetical protein